MVHQKYEQLCDRLHKYLCQQSEVKLEIHQSHKDTNRLFLIRVISFIYLSAIYIWTLVEMKGILTNFIYLTLQGYFLSWLYFALTLQDHLLSKHFNHKGTHVCSRLKHFIEFVFETAMCAQLPITLVFWTFLFPILLKSDSATADSIALNTNLHAGPIVCLLFEFSHNVYCFPKRHLIVILLFGTTYNFINLSVQVIYPPIDWVSILSYVLIIFCYLLVTGTHFFGRWFFYKYKHPILKNRIVEGLISGKISEGEQTLDDGSPEHPPQNQPEELDQK